MGGGVLLSGLAPRDARSQDGSQGPRIQVDESEKNLGTILQGESATANFTFTNVGDQVLVVTRVRSCCGVTATIE